MELLDSSFLQCIQVITHYLFTIVENSPPNEVLVYQKINTTHIHQLVNDFF